MKWGRTTTEKMTESHLKNTINWIKRNNIQKVENSRDNYKEYAIDTLIAYFQSQIACIEAELVFRQTGIDNRKVVEKINQNLETFFDEFDFDDKPFRKGNWQTFKEATTSMKIKSDEKFEKTFGFNPSVYSTS